MATRSIFDDIDLVQDAFQPPEQLDVSAGQDSQTSNPQRPARSMIVRTRFDGITVYWSRLGWSEIYAMEFDGTSIDAALQECRQRFPDAKAVQFEKPSLRPRSERVGPYAR